jgi:uncharacterized peroxidase-related enzyme
MAWIETVAPEKAEGLLGRIYQGAIKRAGRVFGVLRLQSLNPSTLRSSTELYGAIMFGESPLSRAEREMIAVVVSKANDCHY